MAANMFSILDLDNDDLTLGGGQDGPPLLQPQLGNGPPKSKERDPQAPIKEASPGFTEVRKAQKKKKKKKKHTPKGRSDGVRQQAVNPPKANAAHRPQYSRAQHNKPKVSSAAHSEPASITPAPANSPLKRTPNGRAGKLNGVLHQTSDVPAKVPLQQTQVAPTIAATDVPGVLPAVGTNIVSILRSDARAEHSGPHLIPTLATDICSMQTREAQALETIDVPDQVPHLQQALSAVAHTSPDQVRDDRAMKANGGPYRFFTTQRASSRRLQPEILCNDPDNAAVAAWRAGQRETEAYELPKKFDPRSETREAVVSRTGRHFPMFDHIGAKTRTHIVVDVPRGRGQAIARIWGTIGDAATARKDIVNWIWQHLPSRNKRFGPDTPSLSREEWTEIEEAARRDTIRQSFRQPVDRNKTFALLVYLKLSEVSWSFVDILGPNFEALDAIRTECLCHISFVRHSPIAEIDQSFQIVGNSEPRVKDAVRRLMGIVHQQQARQAGWIQWWLIKPSCLHLKVELRPHHAPSSMGRQPPVSGPASKPISYAATPQFARNDGSLEHLMELLLLDSTTLKDLEETEEVNKRSLGAAVMTVLSTLKHYRGCLEMRAHFGACVLTAYPMENRRPKVLYDHEDFRALLNTRNEENNELDGYIAQELPEHIGLDINVLTRAEGATDLLIPLSRSLRGETLPVYCATVVIRDLVKDGVFYQLDVEYQDTGMSTPDEIKRRWLRLEYGEHIPTQFMHVNTLDLEGGLSQRLGIVAAIPVDDERLPKLYHTFADDVEVLVSIAREPTNPGAFFRWPTRALDGGSTVPVVRMRQKRAWRFSYMHSGYMVEVATLQDALWPAANPVLAASAGREGCVPQPYDMRWGVSAWHECWDQWLSENARLGIGESASWQAEEWIFFPAAADYEQSASFSNEASSSANPTDHKDHGTEGLQNSVRTSKHEDKDREVDAMFVYAGSGFATFAQMMADVEAIVLGRHQHQTCQQHDNYLEKKHASNGIDREQLQELDANYRGCAEFSPRHTTPV